LQSQIRSSEAQVELLSAQIADGALVAPASGQIATVNGQPGEIVQANEPLVVLVPDSTLTIDSAVPENGDRQDQGRRPMQHNF